jgi:hypothetical protein
MTADPPDGLDGQVTALRDDVAQLTAYARRAATRIEQLEAALGEVRDLMKHLPAHDQATVVAVRLRGHFDYLATHIIGDALDASRDEDIGPRGPSTDGNAMPPHGAVRVHDLTKGPA